MRIPGLFGAADVILVGAPCKPGFTLGHVSMQVWAYGAVGNDIIVRVGHEHHAEAPARPGARPFDMTGRPMTGWVQVGPEGFATDAELARWVAQGVAFAQTLPPK